MSSDYFQGLKQRRLDNNWNGLIGQQGGFQGSGGGWMNPLTGLGTFGRDKVMQAGYVDPFRIPDPELSALFNGNDLAHRIVVLRPKEMFRRGYALVLPDPTAKGIGQNPNAELALDIEKYAAKLDANSIILSGCIFGRLFGGSIIIIGADDGRDVSKPLNEDNIRSIRYVNLVDRRFLFARSYYGNPFEPKFGEVETYQVTNAFGDQQNTVVHESRVLRFDGAPVDILKRRMLAGWTLSVLQTPYDVLRSFESSFQAVTNLMTDAAQAVFSMNGLMGMITSGEVSAVEMRMKLVDMMRSSGRMMLVDAENEKFERTATPMAGVPEILQVFMLRMSAAAEMPATILFGREPAGMNATGESDFKHFYDTVRSEQKNYLEPKIRRFYKLICLAKDSPTKGKFPEGDLAFHWHKLHEPAETEFAENYERMANADTKYIQAGVLTPEEVALSRFRGADYRLETEIDVEHRQSSMKAETDFHAYRNSLLGVGDAENQPANSQVPPLGPQGANTDPNSGRSK